MAEEKALNKVRQMSNTELRIKAAELFGYENITYKEGPIPYLMDLVEEEWFGTFCGKELCLPLYSTDMDYACELRDELLDSGTARNEFTHHIMDLGNYDDVKLYKFVAYAIEHTLFEVLTPRVITQAYILTMEGE